MTTTEEIVVSGEDFIERRIILWAGQDDINESKNVAYTNGYRRGCTFGFLMGVALIVIVISGYFMLCS